jgi:hypothetical protein
VLPSPLHVAFPLEMFSIPLRENVLTSVLPGETRGRSVALPLTVSVWQEEFWMMLRAHRGEAMCKTLTTIGCIIVGAGLLGWYDLWHLVIGLPLPVGGMLI